MTSRHEPNDPDASGETLTGCTDNLTDKSKAGSALLASTIEGEIIPRLMMTFSVMPSPLAPEQEHDPSGLLAQNEEMVRDLIQLLLTHDAAVSVEYMNALRAKGATLRDLYLDLLAPAARELGEMWNEDIANFTEVTIATSRLHQILLQFSPLFCANAPDQTSNGRTAAIFALPGETHTFGIFMVVEFFRRAGWNVYSGSLGNDGEASQLLSTHDIDVLGISVSAERHLPDLSERIATLRAASRNQDICVLCGGQMFAHNPSLARKLGADGFATDGQQAVDLAESLISEQ
ncbi:MAG: B12-binding domain-containing protein [Gammaproteobacteria bacterium]